MRKNATKLAAAVLSLAMVMTSVNMPASAAKTKVKLNKTKATLYVNGSASEKATTLKVTVNGKKVNATFKSSNTKVLTVAKKTGKVTAKKNGTAKVTATYKKKKYNCTVTVKTYATSVSITSAKTLNLAAGKTATINATVKPSTASNKKVSFASSDKNVATVTSAGKVTAKKAGTATVTVKALGSKKAAKKATVKVNVKAAVKPSTEPTTTPTTEPTATPETPVATEGAITVTTNVSGASIKITDVTSGSSIVETKVVTGTSFTTEKKLAPGKYEVEVSKKGYDTYKETIDLKGDTTINAVLKEAIKTGIEAAVTNSLQIEGIKNSVLVNNDAIVTVTVKDKEGNIVPGKTVVFSLNDKGNNTRPGSLEVKGETVKVTNADGKATFVVGLKNSVSDYTDKSAVASTDYIAKVLDTTDGTETATTGKVGFVALQVSNIVSNSVANGGKLVPGKNAKDKVDSVAKTYSLNNESKLLGDRDVDYIATQQVSSTGKEEHKVTLNAKPYLVTPAMAAADSKASELNQIIPESVGKSGKYGTYADLPRTVILDEEASKLAYATLMFKDITLSKYSIITISSYKDEKCTQKINGADKTIKGPHSQKGFGYQLPVNDGVKAVKVTIKSAGQVQTDQNDGFEMDKIVGVYKKAIKGGTTNISIPSAKITWENVDPTMSDLADLVNPKDKNYSTELAATLKKLGIIPKDVKNEADISKTTDTFKYQVPVFPYTGDAVIKEMDANGKVVGYYLAPTIKSNDETNTLIPKAKVDATAADTTNTKNTNVLAIFDKTIMSAADTAEVKARRYQAYEVTEEEATTHKVGTFKSDADGNNLQINSEKVGSTNMRGTISLPGIGSDVLDASNKYIYTSVQWNPIPNDAANSDAFLALAGQSINVYAQLVDKNGNPVSAKDIDISYTCKDSADNTISLSSADTTNKIGKVAVIKNTKTDKNGKATLTLNSAESDVITNLSAKSSDYNVRLYIGDGNVSTADLYWVNANLGFQKDIDQDFITTENDEKTVEAEKPTAATPWQYAVKTFGNKFDKGVLKNQQITIENLKINTTIDSDNKGSYKISGNGVVDTTSKIASKDRIVNQLDGTSVGNDVTFKINGKSYKCVGEGTANLLAKMNLNVSWEARGIQTAFVTPVGTKIARDKTSSDGVVELYVKVTDETGLNPIKDKVVTFTSNNDANDAAVDTFSDAGISGTESNKAKTDANGIAKIKLTSTAAGAAKSSIIKATVANDAAGSTTADQVASTTVNWTKYDKAFGLVDATTVEGNAKQIKLTFNDDVLASSVRKELFKLNEVGAGAVGTAGNPVEIVDAKADGKYVTLTLKKDISEKTKFEVSVVKDKEINGVTYNVVSTNGIAIDTTNNTETSDKADFYSEGTGKFELAVTKDKEATGIAELEIKNIDVPNTDYDEVVTSGSVNNFKKYFRVVVDGVIQKVDETVDPTDGTIVVGFGSNAYTIKLAQKVSTQKVSVYFVGGTDTKTVEAMSAEKASADITVDAGNVKTAVEKTNESISSGDSVIDITSSLSDGAKAEIKETTTIASGLISISGNKITVKKMATAPTVDRTATFTIKITKGTGTAVTKTFKLTVTASTQTYSIAENI